jgi:hypothetical protein
MIFRLLILVFIEQVLHLLLKLIFLLIEILNYSIELLLFLIVNGLKISVFLTEASQFLNFGGQLLLLVLDLIFNLNDDLSDFLKCLLFLVIEDCVSMRDTLNLIVNISVARDTLLLLEILHELI